MKAKLIKVEDVYRLVEPTKHGNQIIATSDLDYQKTWSDRCQKLSKQNCDEIFGVVDVERLAEESWGDKISSPYHAYIEGFNKAMELYQPTEIEVTFNPEERDSEGCLILKKI